MRPMRQKLVLLPILLALVSCGDWRAIVKQDAAKLAGVELRLTGANLDYLKQKLAAVPVSIRQPHNKKVAAAPVSNANWGESGIVEAAFPVAAGELSGRTEASSIRINSEFPGTLCGESASAVLASKTACGSPVLIRTNDSGRVDIVWNR